MRDRYADWIIDAMADAARLESAQDRSALESEHGCWDCASFAACPEVDE